MSRLVCLGAKASTYALPDHSWRRRPGLILGVVQLLQYHYQKHILYKKRALGESDTMETTTGPFALHRALVYVYRGSPQCFSLDSTQISQTRNP